MLKKEDPLFTEEIHPWNWYTPEVCTVLVVGTFPSARKNWSYDFFYPNLRNNFWKIMEVLSGIALTVNTGKDAVELRKKMLDLLKIGVTDMGLRIGRDRGSSLDADLIVLEYMNILRILDENRGIKKIILTSSSGKSSAFSWFKQYMAGQKTEVDFVITRLPFSGIFEYKGRRIEVRVVPSTSPAAAIGFTSLLEIYKREI
jgi:G:T/U-mismatch repair DNA glycosylase